MLARTSHSDVGNPQRNCPMLLTRVTPKSKDMNSGISQQASSDTISGALYRQPLVTVYIPCRNYGRFLPQAIESVLHQIYQTWELFLVDEGSDDDTSEIMERFRGMHPDRIRVIKHSEPLGLQGSANEVLRFATGQYFIRLDADDWFDEGALLLMVARLENDPSLGLVFGNYYYVDSDGRILGIEKRPTLNIEDVSGHHPPHGACTMVRTRILKAMGGYSEDIKAQDGWELWFRIARHVGAAGISTPLFHYRQHHLSLSRDNQRLLDARAQIFERIATEHEGSYQPTALAVLGVRESYPGIEGVPYRLFEGRTILHHALINTQEASRVTEVMVSSRSTSALAHAEELEKSGQVKPHIRHLRQSDEVDGELPVQQILVEAAKRYQSERGHYPDMLVFCSIHSTYRTPAHLDKVLNVLRVTQSDSVVSVQDEKSVVFSRGRNGLEVLNPGKLSGLRLEREQLYRFNGAMIAVWWNVLNAGSLLGEKVGYVEMTELEGTRIHLLPESYSVWNRS